MTSYITIFSLAIIPVFASCSVNTEVPSDSAKEMNGSANPQQQIIIESNAIKSDLFRFEKDASIKDLKNFLIQNGATLNSSFRIKLVDTDGDVPKIFEVRKLSDEDPFDSYIITSFPKIIVHELEW